MICKFNNYLNGNNENLKFIIDKKNFKFKLFLQNVLVSETSFTIEEYDDWFNEKYVTLFDLKTYENFRNRGYAKYLLNKIFEYVKNILNLNIITIIVYKNNYKALNLYSNLGFNIYIEYDDSFSLIKKL
jgi:ribosomal protein S18 acetylase RimI-like enzyme